MIGLMIGFAFWWTYFAFVGDRRPRTDGGRLTYWMFGHLPVTMSIAATGAAMVSLVWLFAIGLWVKTSDPDTQVPATD